MNYIKSEYIKNQHTIENDISRLLWEDKPDCISLMGIMTKSEYRKMGYGTAIMNEFLKDVANIKKPIKLSVCPFDRWNNFEGKNNMLTSKELEKFYSKFGFVIYRRMKNGHPIMIKK